MLCLFGSNLASNPQNSFDDFEVQNLLRRVVDRHAISGFSVNAVRPVHWNNLLQIASAQVADFN
jgi:hypothetical protein